MAGIYIHVPFCNKKCGYCDFYSIVDQKNKKGFVNTLIDEINLRKKEIYNETISTIYFGGGTPSLLEIEDFNKIFEALSSVFSLKNVVEITIEVNPDDITLNYLTQIRQLGFNRLSIGIQSFKGELLFLMNRRHNVKQAKDAVAIGRAAGFDNISIDLIYGLPTMSFVDWQNTLKEAILLNVEHISSYHLTFEKGTPFYYKLHTGELKEIQDDQSLIQFEELRLHLTGNGFIDYEISNFAKPGKESIHNSSYWTGDHYFGFGPSAHSFFTGKRRWNVSSLSTYMSGIANGIKYYETEQLTAIDIYNELIMLSLRTRKGLNINSVQNLKNPEIQNCFNSELQKQLDKGNVCIRNNFLFVSDNKKFITDQIISDFFIV